MIIIILILIISICVCIFSPKKKKKEPKDIYAKPFTADLSQRPAQVPIKGVSQQIHEGLSREFGGNARLFEIIKRNPEHLEGIPPELFSSLAEMAADSAISGRRSGSLAEYIKQAIPEIPKESAELAARTLVFRVQAAITQIRSQKAGIDWYIWQTSQDQEAGASLAETQVLLGHSEATTTNRYLHGDSRRAVDRMKRGYGPAAETTPVTPQGAPIVSKAARLAATRDPWDS